MALACAGILASYYPASLLGLRIEDGAGNWGTLAFFPLVAIGAATTHRALRLQRAAWDISDQGRASEIMATLEARPPARPRLLGGLLVLCCVIAVVADIGAMLVRGSALPGTVTRMAAVLGLAGGVLLARRADTLARRERKLARWAAAVAA